MSTLQALQGDKISILRDCVLFTEERSYSKYFSVEILNLNIYCRLLFLQNLNNFFQFFLLFY